MDEGPSVQHWKARYKAISNWDEMYAEGKWEYLDDLGECPRYSLIAGYINRRFTAMNVLDVGCGSGVLLKYLNESRVRYCGIDLSVTAIQQATERFPNAQFSVCGIDEYHPPRTLRLDAVVFNEVLPHVDDPFGSLARYIGFLRPGGIAIISTYQNADAGSNAAMFTTLLDKALHEGDFRALTGCEVKTFDQGLKWRIDVVGALGIDDDKC